MSRTVKTVIYVHDLKLCDYVTMDKVPGTFLHAKGFITKTLNSERLGSEHKSVT